jgi:hypothetical protein
MIQEPAGVGAVIASRLGKFIQKHPFFCQWRFAICGCHLFKHCSSCLKTQSYSHTCLLRNRLAQAPDVATTETSPSFASRNIVAAMQSIAHPFLFNWGGVDNGLASLSTEKQNGRKQLLKRGKRKISREAMRLHLSCDSPLGSIFIGSWGEPRGREVIQMAQRGRRFLLPCERMERIH